MKRVCKKAVVNITLLTPLVDFANIVGIKTEQLLSRSFLTLSMVTAFVKNVPIFNPPCKSCNLKHVVKCQCKCW